MFAYCINNPVNYVDISGNYPIPISATWQTYMWWICLLDGPLPIGDFIYLLGCAITVSAFLPEIVNQCQSYVNNKENDLPEKYYNQSVIDMGSSTVEPPNNHSNKNKNNNKRNWQKVNERYLERELKKQHTNPHNIKREYLGRRAEISRYDIYVDKSTGQLAIFLRTTKEMVEITSYFI